MLESEGLDAVLPGINSVAEGIQSAVTFLNLYRTFRRLALTFQYDLMDLGVLIYRQFYSEEKESLQGIIGIHVLSPPEEKQPLAIVGSMLQVIVSLPEIVV